MNDDGFDGYDFEHLKRRVADLEKLVTSQSDRIEALEREVKRLDADKVNALTDEQYQRIRKQLDALYTVPRMRPPMPGDDG